MSLFQLLRGGPRNVRKNLFRDIIVIVLLTVISITSLAMYRGLSIKDQVSTELLTGAGRLIQKRFSLFLSPYESSLEVLARTDAAKNLGHSLVSERVLATLFYPYLDVYENLGAITLIQSSGKTVFMERSDSGLSTTIRDGTGGLNPALPETAMYRGALAAPADAPVFWSESFTSRNDKSGISASISVQQNGGGTIVIAFTIPGTHILQFIADIETVEGVEIVLFNQHGLFISKQHLLGAQAGSKRISSSPSQNQVKKAIESWIGKGGKENGIERFRVEGMKWWAGFNKLGAGAGDGFIGVLVPESGIIEDVHTSLFNLAVPIGLILLFALAMTFNLVRRYSFQLKDLPQQHLLENEFTDNIKRLIHLGESATVEFKSTVRKNIKADRFGKEIELAWLKTVTAFMNSDGGILLIGVADNGMVTGLAPDGFSSEDKCRLHVKNLINNHLGTAFSRYVHLSFCQIDSETILVLECERVRQPVFLFIGKNEEFYVRSGPASMKLSMSAMVTYLSQR